MTSEILSAAALTALAAVAPAQTITPLVLEGDAAGGVGLVTRIDNVAINNSCEYLVETDTDNADTDADGVLFRSGAVYQVEGQSLAAPVGATLDSWDAITLNEAGNSGWNFFLDGTSGSSDDSGLYWNLSLLIQEGADSTAPQLSPMTPYRGFFEAKINDSNAILYIATVDDPAITSTVDQILALAQVDGSGNLISETVLAKEGDILPGQTEPVATFGTGPHNFAFNDSGDRMFFADLTGDTAVDGVIYGNTAVLAQEGSPSPVAGRNWSSLSSPELDLSNTGGHYVYSGSLDGDSASNLVIIKNGVKFQQEGDLLVDPSVSTFAIQSFGTGPIHVADDGSVLWYCDFDDANTDTDTGLFLNDTLLVRENVTTIGGVLVDTIRGISDGYMLSNNGKFVIFRAVLADGTDGAFLIDLSGPTNYCTALPNSTGNPASLGWSGSTSVSANDLVLSATDCPRNVNGLMIYSPEPDEVPLGNGNLCLSNAPLGFILRLPFENSGPVGVMTHALDNTSPPDPAGLITPGSTWYFQCWFRDVTAPPEFFNFSDGLEITFKP